jgi:hypothetical protein
MKRIALITAVLALAGWTPAEKMKGEHKLLILVNSADTLYRVDPATFDVTAIGTFSFPGGTADRITDIAIDRKGRMWAVGFEAVYSVDRKTLACTLLSPAYGHELNSLAIVTSAMVAGRESPDLMLAGESSSSSVYMVDPATGNLTVAGDMGGGLVSGGDMTWAPGVGAVQIATDKAGYEGLVHLDANTFTAHPIGPGWAFQKVRGIAMLEHGLLGVSEQGEMIEIDPTTGDATLRKTQSGIVFYGGAVGWDE